MPSVSPLIRACAAVAVILSAGLIGSRMAWAAQGAPRTQGTARAKAGEVLKQPFKDLNVLQDIIPEALLKAKAAPYAKPREANCLAVRMEIYELDYALGEDLDVQTDDDSKSKKIADETYNLARGAVSGLIPYRGILRRVTGAEKHARAINEALLAGAVRRSYLKGFGESLGCAYPAAPKRTEPLAEQSP